MVEPRLIILTRYGRLGASSRVRFHQYLHIVEKLKFHYELAPLINDNMLNKLYYNKSYKKLDLAIAYLKRCLFLFSSRDVKLIWIEKELFPFCPFFIEKLFLKNKIVIVDYDDAIFHNYDSHRSFIIRFLFGKKIVKIMLNSDLVIAGNEYIARYANESGSDNVVILPTAVDPKKYAPKLDCGELNGNKVRIVWIGSPSTINYLYELKDVLKKLIKNHNCQIVIIGAETTFLGRQNIKFVPWSEDIEASEISTCDIGIMPLPDLPFERGKCGYKLLQYMSCCLPVVASPVGVNEKIVEDGVSGFLASSKSEWYEKLEVLIQNKELRIKMGVRGRERVEELYSVDAVGSEWEMQLVELRKKITCVE